MKLIDIVQLTNNKFLNMYKLKLINRKGNPKDYFVASRRDRLHLSCVTKDHNVCDGVMIIPITEDGEIVMLKQYRPAISDYLYELPAGIVDPGESIESAAKRELYEETGLIAKSYEVYLKPSYTSVGLTDETTAIVKMVVEGEITNEHAEADEDLEVFKLKISDAKKFVESHNVSIKGALILMSL
ncbi:MULTISPECIES: NUDIX hydrolase [Clostridium]|uniref:NUDIX hydrolase n=1 Tax=Clostridium cibarium TaxID=2762247 RepID=A0ABR8PXX9_9CLOT|nr:MULTISPECIES: NUDIX hydrolase [Clostridium]MBD7913024.1 NUDIX hydrolase [Clostridium cibarium]